jgi:DNA-binding CsgD family transcriptional regulator/PAS domain-containing protein
MPRATHADEDAVIHRIYAGVDDANAWHDVMAALVQTLRSESGILGLTSTSAGAIELPITVGLDVATLPRYNDEHTKNPWALSILRLPVGQLVASDAYVPFDELKRSTFHAEILAPQRIAHGAWLRLAADNATSAQMSIHRSARLGPYAASELAAASRFLPHLGRAAQLRLLLRRSEGEKQLALAALEGLAAGVLLLDGSGRALFANRTARELAATRDAIMLDARGVRARHRSDDRVFQLLIGSATAGGAAGAVALSRASGGLPLVALVAPLMGALAAMAARAGLASGAAGVFLTDPERQAEPPAERLQALFGLTPTEARVALHLVRAGTIARAAHALGLAPETVRTHLKRIYGKTGINHQGALARLLSAAAVLHAP